MIEENTFCSCYSGISYHLCCAPFHQGKKVDKALLLMRSRYSAYAYQLADYIIETTHPDSPYYQKDKVYWKKTIVEFSKKTTFENLKILSCKEEVETAIVTFTAFLKQGTKDTSFTEISFFKKLNGKWLYVKAETE